MGWKVLLTANKHITEQDYNAVRDTILSKFQENGIQVNVRVGTGPTFELHGSYSSKDAETKSQFDVTRFTSAATKAPIAAEVARSAFELKGYSINVGEIQDAEAPSAPRKSSIILL